MPRPPRVCALCDRAGRVEPYRARVFCASLADVFEGPETMPAAAVPEIIEARCRLLDLIDATWHLDWLLLTKRPEGWAARLGEVVRLGVGGSRGNGAAIATRWLGGKAPPNVWMGTSVEDQARADERLPHLAEIPAVVKFISAEPLLGPVELNGWDGKLRRNWLGPKHPRAVHWVIIGGESGHGARAFDLEWCESLVGQCREAEVACFVKQIGARPMACGELIQVGHKKGGDVEDWPEHLRVRQLPGP